MTNADFYLDIARQELRKRKRLTSRIRLSTSGYSRHFYLAVICSVFSAFAVEHAITELIWGRCFFQTPEPYRRIALQHAAKVRTIEDKLKFVKATTRIEPALLDDIKNLFEYRNKIAHCRVKTFEGKVLDVEEVQDLLDAGKGAELNEAIEKAMAGKAGSLQGMVQEFGQETRHLQLEGIGTEDLEAAERNFAIAERAVGALHSEMESDEWRLPR